MTPHPRTGNRSTFRMWDDMCLRKHLGAVRESMATPEELDAFLLGENEGPLHILRLAGVSDAPGLHQDVAQRCRMTFTTKDRLIFAQVVFNFSYERLPRTMQKSIQCTLWNQVNSIVM